MRSLVNSSRLFSFFAAVICTFVLGLVLNAYHQASVYRARLASLCQIAVFLQPDATVDVVREKLLNMDGISGVTLITADKVLEKALQDSPSVKEILISGKNPFTAYFLVVPQASAFSRIETLKSEAAAITGVEDVRFDAALIENARKLDVFAGLYKKAFIATLIAGILLIVGRLWWRWYNKKLVLIDTVYSLALGAAAGITGAGICYLAGYRLFPFQGIQLTAGYLPYLIGGGVLTAFLWEK